jgi:hypothetical protein
MTIAVIVLEPDNTLDVYIYNIALQGFLVFNIPTDAIKFAKLAYLFF